MMAEIVRETQNPRHVTTAYLRRRFADLPIEGGCLFYDQDARFGLLAFQHECCRRAGKRAPDDHDVVIEIHRSKRMAFLLLQGKGTSDANNRFRVRRHDRNDYFD